MHFLKKIIFLKELSLVVFIWDMTTLITYNPCHIRLRIFQIIEDISAANILSCIRSFKKLSTNIKISSVEYFQS